MRNAHRASPWGVKAFAAGIALLLAGCSSPRELSAAERQEIARIKNLLELFIRGDPTWPRERAAAIRDPRTAELLVGNFFRAMDRAFRREHTAGVLFSSSKAARFQRELVAMAGASTPILIVGLRSRDKVSAQLAADTLTEIGVRAVAALEERYRQSGDVEEKRRILAIYGRMQDPAQIDALLAAGEDPHWELRGEALAGAGHLAGVAGVDAKMRAEVRAHLGRHLTDPDAFVRRKVAEGLGELGDTDALRMLIERLKHISKEITRESLAERGHLVRTIQHATGLLKTSKVEVFERWLAQRADGR